MLMDLLVKTGAVRLRSHLDKFLVGDEDNETVRQSRNGSSKRAIWIVEATPKNPDTLRLKNYNSGLYLTASDSPFLLGMTGKRVLQLSIFDPNRVEWEPISDGFQLKFRSRIEGKYLRANGGTPPWRNSVTYDTPLTGASKSWTMWDVEPVTDLDLDLDHASSIQLLSPLSSFTSVYSDDSLPASPLSLISTATTHHSFTRKRSGMDLFYNAKTVRLRSHHDKYLIAEDDEESVTQDRNGSARNARWTVEFLQDGIRLKSCYAKYLTASNQPFLLGMTGRKVLQTLPRRLDSSIEWDPIKDGSQVRLKTKYGNFLRANGGLPPWRNSVTHDVPHRTATQEWIVWDVDILEILDHSPPLNNNLQDLKPNSNPNSKPTPIPVHVQQKVGHSDSFGSDISSLSNGSDMFQRQESSDSGTYSPPKHDGRAIYYRIADEYGGVDDRMEEGSFTFKGHNVTELTLKLEEETGFEDIIVCTRSPLNGKLYPLRLQLPPNNATMHIVVVPSTSTLAQEFS